MAGPVFRSKSFQGQSSGTSVSATEPAGATSGDVLLALIAVGGNPTLTVPSGWTLIPGTTYAGTAVGTKVYWIARGGSAPSYSWSWTGAQYAELIVLCYSGADNSTPWNVVQLASNNSVSAPVTCPAVTTTVPDTAVVLLGMYWGGIFAGTWGAPSTYTIREPNSTTFGDSGAADKSVASVGTETPGAWSGSWAGTGQNSSGVTLALKSPQGGAPSARPMFMPKFPGRGRPRLVKPVPIASSLVPVTVTATVATHTYTGVAPQVRAQVQPPVVTHTYTAQAPRIVGVLRAGVVTHTYVAQVPQVQARVQPGVVTHTYTAQTPQVRARVMPGVATHTYTALAPQVRAKVQPGVATHTYTGAVPTITVSGGATTVSAPVVTHTYSAVAPKVNASVAPAAATHTYTALAPVTNARLTVSAPVVTHSYTARAPQAQARVQPGVVTHTYLALNPALLANLILSVPTATHTYTAQAPSISQVTVSAQASGGFPTRGRRRVFDYTRRPSAEDIARERERLGILPPAMRRAVESTVARVAARPESFDSAIALAERTAQGVESIRLKSDLRTELPKNTKITPDALYLTQFLLLDALARRFDPPIESDEEEIADILALWLAMD